MEAGKQRPVMSMEEARDWEWRFIGEVKAGRDPRRPLRPAAALSLDNVSGFLDAYFARCVKPERLMPAAETRGMLGRIEDLRKRLRPLAKSKNSSYSQSCKCSHSPTVVGPPNRIVKS